METPPGTTGTPGAPAVGVAVASACHVAEGAQAWGLAHCPSSPAESLTAPTLRKYREAYSLLADVFSPTTARRIKGCHSHRCPRLPKSKSGV